MTSTVVLKTNRNLLNPNFETYRLDVSSKNFITSYAIPKVFVSKLGQDEYSYQHVKAFGGHNHLFNDPWNINDVYFAAEDNQIYMVRFPEISNDRNLADSYRANPLVRQVFHWKHVPQTSANSNNTTDSHSLTSSSVCNVTVRFVSPYMAVVCHGHDWLSIVDTGSRQNDDEGNSWQILWAGSPLEDVHGTSISIQLLDACIIDGTMTEKDASQHCRPPIECVLLSVDRPGSAVETVHARSVDSKRQCCKKVAYHATEDNQEEDSETSSKGSKFLTYLHWMRFEHIQESYILTEAACFQAPSAPDYVALEPQTHKGRALHIFSSRIFKDPISCQPVNVKDEEVYEKPIFTWTQNNTEVCIELPLPISISDKHQVVVEFTVKSLHVAFKNNNENGNSDHQLKSVLKGHLFSKIDVDSSTWTFQHIADKGVNQLDIHLFKSVSDEEVADAPFTGATHWPFLFTDGNAGGCQLFPESEMQTVDEPVAKESTYSGNAFNLQQYEECDRPDTSDDSRLYRLDVASKECTHMAHCFGQRVLFVTDYPPANINDEDVDQSILHSQPKCLCLQNDVDGLLWMPTAAANTNKGAMWRHALTYPALDYVLASKQGERKFVLSSFPHHRYVVMTDAKGLLFLYYQPLTQTATKRKHDDGDNEDALLEEDVDQHDGPGVLRNRKTGSVLKASSVARQQVIRLLENSSEEADLFSIEVPRINAHQSLSNQEDIVGCVALDGKLYILKQSRLFMVHLVNS